MTNDELEKFRLHFSRCPNREVAPLSLSLSNDNDDAEEGVQ